MDIDASGESSVGIEPNLDLANPFANKPDLANARKRFEVLFEPVINQLSGLAQVSGARYNYADDRRSIGGDLVHHRRIGVFGQSGHNLGHFVAYFLGCHVGILA